MRGLGKGTHQRCEEFFLPRQVGGGRCLRLTLLLLAHVGGPRGGLRGGPEQRHVRHADVRGQRRARGHGQRLDHVGGQHGGRTHEHGLAFEDGPRLRAGRGAAVARVQVGLGLHPAARMKMGTGTVGAGEVRRVINRVGVACDAPLRGQRRVEPLLGDDGRARGEREEDAQRALRRRRLRDHVGHVRAGHVFVAVQQHHARQGRRGRRG